MPFPRLLMCAAWVLCCSAGTALAGSPIIGLITGAPTLVGATMGFPTQPVSSTSPVQTETLTAHLGSAAPIPPGTAVKLVGTSIDNPEFAITGGTCAPNLIMANGDNCTLQMQFTPSVAGTRNAQLSVRCAVVSVVGVIGLVCDDTSRPFIQLTGVGTVLGALAAAVPALGTGSLTILALLLFVGSVLLMQRRR